jgi:hypothetical protein
MDKILKQFGIDKLTEAVKVSNSFVEATAFLGLDPKLGNIKKNVERSIKRLGLSTDHFDSVQRLKTSKTRYTKEKLEILVNRCKNYKEILEELDILPITNNYDKLKRKLNEFKIDFSHLKNQRQHLSANWEINNLEKIINESYSQKEVLEKLGLRCAGGNFNTLRNYIKLYNLDTSHFIKCNNKILNFKNKIPTEDILIENSNYKNRDNIKKRLYEEFLKERKCELCGQGEEWNGKKMSLILDHINGIYNDNRLENLRIVCPNCNATLPTHCGKHKSYRSIKLKENGYNSDDKIDFRKNLTNDNFNNYISRRKIERPSFDVLKNEINALGYRGVGRKYNVSDSAIRKWMKTYEKYGK